jgi:two-component system CheB/CheR fusion protein
VRFFTEEEAGYRICKEIRERCVFSRHNVLGDPPFSRVDLISCRNMLIYMEPVLQKRIMSLLHYALNPDGFLWLGKSETASASRALFDVKDARHKIFARRPGDSPPSTRFRPALGGGKVEPFLRPAATQRAAPRADLHKEAERILLTKYTPPGVVISAAMEIVNFRGNTGAYLAPAAGAASLDLLKMLREGLLVGVRAAIIRAEKEGRMVREEGLRVKSEAGFRELAVEVIPIKASATKESGFLVIFDEVRNDERGSRNDGKGLAAAEVSGNHQTAQDSAEVARLTQELAATREYLQAVIEQQEAANEELQSANEEAQSANEEMQSVNEELETSKEEIQSSNEELATVNDELNNRNLELSRLNNTLQLARDYAVSIVASMRSPLVVLDAALRVRTASAAFYETFHVAAAATEGRLIYDLGNGQWNVPALRTLLEDLLPRDRQIDDYEVRHTFDEIGPRIMLLNAQRLAPGAADHEPLIVLAIEDITERARAEEHNKLLMAEVNHRAKNLLDVVQAVAQQTAKHADRATFVERLIERIGGLATSQDLLVKNLWKGVEVMDLVKGQLAHFQDLIGTRVLLEGPRARLRPAAAQGIGMALHELATNASKYGALSNKRGRVRISWQIAAAREPMFTMQWLEEGGPKVAAPTHKGFGQIVIGRMVEAAVDGTAEIDYRENGLSWKLSAPIADALESGRVTSPEWDAGG